MFYSLLSMIFKTLSFNNNISLIVLHYNVLVIYTKKLIFFYILINAFLIFLYSNMLSET